MKVNLRRGASDFVGLIVLAVLLIIVYSTPRETWRVQPIEPGTAVATYRDSSQNQTGITAIRNAPQAQYISITSGNAPYTYQPYEEYVTIENTGPAPVDITGWKLRNGKDKRPYYSGNTLQRYSADISVIPQAARLLTGTDQNTLSNVVLEPGERAVVTTGKMGVQSPYKIVSFKENMCTGYLENMREYAFLPSLSFSCPRPSTEPGIELMDAACRDFINTLSACETPIFENKDSNGEYCDTCIRGQRLSSVCANFIKEHFNYGACVAYHGRDKDFSGKTWRIFLGRSWEMWADKYETVELFNRFDQLVDYQNY